MADPNLENLERIRDIVNALRGILSGQVPEDAISVLTEKGTKALNDLLAIPMEERQDALRSVETVEQFVTYVQENEYLTDKDYIVQEDDPTTPKLRTVFPDFTLREAQVLHKETTTRIIELTGVEDDDFIIFLHNYVAENLLADITINPNTGNPERPGGVPPPSSDFSGRMGFLIQDVLLQVSEEAAVDSRYLLKGNKVGLMIDSALANGILSPVGAATLKMVTLEGIAADFPLPIAQIHPDDIREAQDLHKETTARIIDDARAWLDNVETIIESNTATIVSEGIAAIENKQTPKRFDTAYMSYAESQAELDPLDEDRELYQPGFDPREERVRQEAADRLEAFGPEDKKFKAQVLDRVGQKGGIKDPNVEPSLLDDPDRKQAASGTNKIVVANAETVFANAKAQGDTDFEAFNAAMDYVDLWFVAPEGPEGLGPTPYTNSIDRRAGILEAADLSDETKHKKAVKNAYFNTTRLSTDDLHPDVLKRLYSTLAGSTREGMLAFIEENQDDIRLQSKLAGMQSSEDLISLLKGIEGMPTLDQLDSPEAKTAFKRWLEDSVDAIQAAEPAPSFGARLTRGAFPSGPPDPVGPAKMIEAKIAAFQGALDQLNPVLTQAGEVVAAAAVQEELDKQAAVEATYWTSKRGEEQVDDFMFKEGFLPGTINSEDRLWLERAASGPQGIGVLGTTAQQRAIFEGFQTQKEVQTTFETAGFAPDVARAAATDRIAEGFDINMLGEIVPKPLYRTEHQVIPGIDPSYPEFGGLPGVDPSAPTYTEFEPVPTLTNEQRLEQTRIQLDPSGFPQRPTVDAFGNPIPTTPEPFDPVAETERGKRSMAAEQAAEAARVASQRDIDEQTATAEWERAVARAGGAKSQVAPEATFLAKHKAGRLQRAAERQAAASPPVGVDPFPDETERRRRRRLRGRGRTVMRT